MNLLLNTPGQQIKLLSMVHHGYLLPYEGPNNIGYASFSFDSLAAYEKYRDKIPSSPKCQDALNYAKETKCIISYERSFCKPVFNGISDKAMIFPDDN